MKCALIIGHKANRPGACNAKHNVCEYQFNDALAVDIYDELKIKHPEIHLVLIRRRTYSQLPGDINNFNPVFAISMHCNAVNSKLNFTETLYYHTSTNGKKLAEIVQKNIVKEFGFKDRGVRGRTVEDRGGTLLKYTKMPVVIAEPFCIDNDEAYEEVVQNLDKLKNAYMQSIVEAHTHFSS